MAISLSKARTQNILNPQSDLIEAVQALSSARDMNTVMAIVRTAARRITNSDGATFVLKDGEFCHYADEDAIGPLWKGQRFPMELCISGWAMKHSKPAVIADIYQDNRIPMDAYKVTFVKSLVMVPIRVKEPIGAIGTYWATQKNSEEYVEILQALANSTSLAIENIQLYSTLQKKISDLEQSHYDLSRFTWMASHDFNEPLRKLNLWSDRLKAELGAEISEEQEIALKNILSSSTQLNRMIDGLLTYFSVQDVNQNFKRIYLEDIILYATAQVRDLIDETKAEVSFDKFPYVYGDPKLLGTVFQNLFHNAIKFRSDKIPKISIGCKEDEREWIFSVTDNGIGIPEKNLKRIFEFFYRLHPQDKYPGAGIGLAICKKIIESHQGRIWIESTENEKTTVCFTLPKTLLSTTPSENSAR